MAAVIETPECFPRDVCLGSLLVATAGAPDHGRCPGGQTVPGVLGGWVCPCPCHRTERDSEPPRDDTRDPSKTVYFGRDDA